MKFATKKEKKAFRQGCIVGSKQKQKKALKRTKGKSAVKTSKSAVKRSKYNDDFLYTESGRIKGDYTVDGRFEPD